MGRKDGLPVPDMGGGPLALRNLLEGGRSSEGGDDSIDGNRSGMQRDSESGSSGPDSPVSFGLLLSFTRHLIRNMVSGDVLMLALYAARSEQQASDEEVKNLARAILAEHNRHGIWPKGF